MSWVGAVILVALGGGCGAEPIGPFSQVGDEVELEGWVDTAHALVGDGATSFDSFPRSGDAGDTELQPWQPNFFEEEGFDAGPHSMVVGEHLLSLSRYRGLVSTRVAGADAPAVDGSVALDGLPVGLFVSGGVAAVLVVDLQKPGCVIGDCIPGQTSRVVLVDVRDPASPQKLGEQRFEGTVSAARQVNGRLHVLSREVVRCDMCESVPRRDFVWLDFDRRSARTLAAPRRTPLSRDAFFSDDRLFSLALNESATASELRFADLSDATPALSPPIRLAGPVLQARASDGRLRVRYDRSQLEVETFALDADVPLSLGRATLAAPEGEWFGWLGFYGGRAVSMLAASQRLVLLDLSAPNTLRLASTLELGLAEPEFAIEGDRLVAVGRSTLPAGAPPSDPVSPDERIPLGPQALVLVDIADLAAPRVVDRVGAGSSNSIHIGAPELSGERVLFRYSEYLGSPEEAGTCGRWSPRLVGYDLASGALVPAFAFEGVDAEASVESVGDDWWLASDISVSRYRPGAEDAADTRLELTRAVDRLQPLAAGVALFGRDVASYSPLLELAPSSAVIAPATLLDVSAAVGLPRSGCDEQRRWFAPLTERDGHLYALRTHRSSDAGAPAGATLHVLDARLASAASPAQRGLELEPLATGEAYVGVVPMERTLLIARGSSAEAESASSTSTGDDPWSPLPWEIDYGDIERPGTKLVYDVVDLSAPSAPALASRLELDPALTTFGRLRAIRGVTRDTGAGFQDEHSTSPVLTSGTLLSGFHAESASNQRARFYLDRIDLTDPKAPVALPSIEVPGNVLDFDARTGGLITLDALLFREPSESPECSGVVHLPGQDPSFCAVQRRALDALVLDGDRATRVGRLIIDTSEREAVRFAVSSNQVYYVTQPNGLRSDHAGPFAARDITLQRVVLRDGRFERLASFDVAGSSNLPPRLWTQFVARGDRALWVAGAQLFVADFGSDGARLEVHELGIGGCDALALQGDTAYCAQGRAGYRAIPLGQP